MLLLIVGLGQMSNLSGEATQARLPFSFLPPFFSAVDNFFVDGVQYTSC